MSKNNGFSCGMLLLTAAVLLCGAIIFCWQRGYTERRRLQDMFIDDTLYADEIAAAAEKHGLNPQLVRALIKKESRFKKNTVGEAGEIGLMQVLPRGAAAEWARIHKCQEPERSELFEVKTNLDIGCWYLARAMKKWQDYRYRTQLALAEYNAGAKNADRWKPENKNGEVIERIDFPTTRKYVQDITQSYHEYLIETEP